MQSDGPRPTKPDISARSYAFAVAIVRFCSRLEAGSQTRGPIIRQLLRSGTSVGANVQEAQAGQSRKDFASKMTIALKEARETVYWLRLLGDSGLVESNAVSDLLTEAQSVTNILGAIVRTCRRPQPPPAVVQPNAS
jgi:four helix bundle protein